MQIAFLGLGLMGLPMARNLVRAGCAVRAWNRTPAKAMALLRPAPSVPPVRSVAHADGAIASTVAEAVTGCDAVVSMLSDGNAVQSVLHAALDTLKTQPAGVWVDMSSTRPQEARTNAHTLETAGWGFADAPVSGGTRGAHAASLAIMCGATPEVFARIQPMLSHMGRAVHVGDVGTGQLTKLANQAIVAATIGAVAEATLLLERGGANTQAARTALQGGFADSPILRHHGARMCARDFSPGGRSRLQLKDLENVLDVAGLLGLHLPMTQQTRDRFHRYVTHLGGGERDHSGLFEVLVAENGEEENVGEIAQAGADKPPSCFP